MAKQTRKRTTSRPLESMTPGTVIRMETPSSGRKAKPSTTAVVVGELQEINPVGGFFNFLREYSVVGLAIGFIIGLQAQTLVKQLVSSFIDPAFQLFFGQALQSRVFTWHFHDHMAHFGWGAFVYGLFSFFFVLASIYVIVKLFKLDRLEKPSKKQINKMNGLQ